MKSVSNSAYFFTSIWHPLNSGRTLFSIEKDRQHLFFLWIPSYTHAVCCTQPSQDSQTCDNHIWTLDSLKSFRINKTLKQVNGLSQLDHCLKSFRINKTLKLTGSISQERSGLKSFRINKTLKLKLLRIAVGFGLKSFRINKTLKPLEAMDKLSLCLKSFRINKTLKRTLRPWTYLSLFEIIPY